MLRGLDPNSVCFFSLPSIAGAFLISCSLAFFSTPSTSYRFTCTQKSIRNGVHNRFEGYPMKDLAECVQITLLAKTLC